MYKYTSTVLDLSPVCPPLACRVLARPSAVLSSFIRLPAMSGSVPTIRAVPALPGVWKGLRANDQPAVRTGVPALDAVLPGRGLPLGAVTEIVPMAESIGEVSLVLPALRRLAEQKPVMVVRPPHVLNPRAWANAGIALSRLVAVEARDDADARWAAEQALRSGAVSAVLLWTETRADVAVRRLQLAASETSSLALVYRPPAVLRNGSAAAVRVALHPGPRGTRIEVLKARGGRAGEVIPFRHRPTA